MALVNELLPIALFWLLGRGKKTTAAAPSTVVVPPGVPTPGAPSAAAVPWPSAVPQMAPTTPGEPLAFPAAIPFAPMYRDDTAATADYGGADIPARMRTGPVRAERQDATHALMAREQQPFRRSYWRPKTRGLGPYVATAKALLKEWTPGGYRFSGPRTWSGRVQYRMTMHGGKRAVEVFEPAPPFV